MSSVDATSLDDWALRLSECIDRSAKTRTNETELREDADPVIRQAAKSLYGIGDLSVTAERRVAKGSLRHYDKAYAGLVVEWEWHMNASHRQIGAKQALDYLKAMRGEVGEEKAFSAVVSDGLQWGFLADDEVAPNLFQESEPTPAERFEWRPNSVAACRQFLELIGSNRQTAVTGSNLRAAFGPSSERAIVMVRLLSEALRGRTKEDRADTLFREWSRSMAVVYGDLSKQDAKLAVAITETYQLRAGLNLGELLFTVHTYFSLVARLVAVEVLALSKKDRDSQPANWPSLDDPQLIDKFARLERGEIPPDITVHNLFEADVFSWYLPSLNGNLDLLNGVRQLLVTLGGFAFPRIAYGANPATDILRDLYQSLVPRALRKALGEFLTPPWLAEACLERLSSLGAAVAAGRVLDPTCGTGTFLLPVLRERLRRLRLEFSEQVQANQVQGTLDSVVGIDINPVAIIAARVNYITTLGNLATIGEITLPIWRADSVLLPDQPVAQSNIGEGRLVGRPWLALQTSLGKPFPIPPALATAENMPTLRWILESALSRESPKDGVKAFLQGLEAQFAEGGAKPLHLDASAWTDVLEVALELYDRVRKLKDEDRNGVWAGIIENSFAPVFAGRFDVVVGNPPWLTWTKLPEEWRKRSELSWKRYGLWRIPREPGRQQRNLASTDLATLVLAVSVDRYLRESGTLGLLMPKAIVNADPGNRAIRRFRLKADSRDQAEVSDAVNVLFRPLFLDDWGQVHPFAPDAANTPIFLAVRKGESVQYPVPTATWHRRGLRLASRWLETQHQVEAVKGESAPVVRDPETSAWSFHGEGTPALLLGGSNTWEFGKGLDTRGANGIFIVKVLKSEIPKNRLLVENIPAEGRDARVEVHRGNVEASLVKPLLRGHDVQPWVARPSSFIVAPYDPNNMALLTPAVFEKQYATTRNWLARFKTILASRKTPPNRNWDMANDGWYRLDGPLQHMKGEATVVVRELQDGPAAAVLTKRYNQELGGDDVPLIDHKLLFCSVGSRREAIYLAGMINSTPVQDLLKSFLNQIAVSPQTLARLPIPPFDEGTAREVIEASLACITAAGKDGVGEAEQGNLDRAVAKLLGFGTDYRPQPRRQIKRSRRQPAEAEQGDLPLEQAPLTDG